MYTWAIHFLSKKTHREWWLIYDMNFCIMFDFFSETPPHFIQRAWMKCILYLPSRSPSTEPMGAWNLRIPVEYISVLILFPGIAQNIKATAAGKAASDPTSSRNKGCKLTAEPSHISDLNYQQRTPNRSCLPMSNILFLEQVMKANFFTRSRDELGFVLENLAIQ